MDHTMHTPLATSELNDETLIGATVYGPGDHNVGSVAHLHGTGPTAHAVVDVGGFLGIGAKPVAIPLSEIRFMRDEDGGVHGTTTWTKDQLKDLPEHHH